MSENANAVPCRGCEATGDCSACRGKGFASIADSLFRNRHNNQEGKCTRCGGTGICPGCGGSGV